jgi:hypothetical protein
MKASLPNIKLFHSIPSAFLTIANPHQPKFESKEEHKFELKLEKCSQMNNDGSIIQELVRDKTWKGMGHIFIFMIVMLGAP